MRRNSSGLRPDPRFHLRLRVPRRAGFSLVEMLVTLTIGAVIVALGLPALVNLIQRSKLEGQARSLAVMMARARSEAVTQGVETVVLFEDGAFLSFADIHGTDLSDPPDGVWNPVAGQPQRATDWQIGRQLLNRDLALTGPGAQPAVDGFTNPNRPDARAIFNPDGSLYSVGAFRLADGKGNHLEVVLAPRATGQVTLRKWDGSAWREQGEGGESWDWN